MSSFWGNVFILRHTVQGYLEIFTFCIYTVSWRQFNIFWFLLRYQIFCDKDVLRRFYGRTGLFVQNLDQQNNFLNGELYMI